eukprot:COSAG02_NODE_1066_length_14828_cov_8.021794_10_plen_106_part_00
MLLLVVLVVVVVVVLTALTALKALTALPAFLRGVAWRGLHLPLLLDGEEGAEGGLEASSPDSPSWRRELDRSGAAPAHSYGREAQRSCVGSPFVVLRWEGADAEV